jgi:hypothetical protein
MSEDEDIKELSTEQPTEIKGFDDPDAAAVQDILELVTKEGELFVMPKSNAMLSEFLKGAIDLGKAIALSSSF